MNVTQAIILAIIEGLTEFLPVSSTGHLIIGSSVMGIASDEFTKLWTVAIQFGTILSVLVLYWKRFFQTWDFYWKIAIGSLPAFILGLLLSDWIDSLLESVITVAVMLVVGGVIFILLDKWFERASRQPDKILGYRNAFIIGIFQCLAMIPGTSRSASTIIGGLTQNLNRKQAAEFSFFLAIPVMLGAACLKIYQYYNNGYQFDTEQWLLFGIGNLVGFIVAMIAIKSFISYITRRGFKAFGYYRIAVGLIIIILYFAGISLEIV